MSHPLGSYNETSLEILKSLKVLLGFRDNMFVNNKMKNINNSNLEIAREDHALIMKKMKIWKLQFLPQIIADITT